MASVGALLFGLRLRLPFALFILKIPRNPSIILHPITPIKPRLIGDEQLHRPSRQRVIHDRERDGAGLLVGDVFPAGGLLGATAFALPGKNNPGQPLTGGRHNPAVLVVPGVAFVLLHHRELHAEDGDQFFEGELDGLVHR